MDLEKKSGDVIIETGSSPLETGRVRLASGGAQRGTPASGGSVEIAGGDGSIGSTSEGGSISISGGRGTGDSISGGSVRIRSGDSTTCFIDHDAGSVCASRTYPRECCVEPHVIEGWVAGAHLEGVSGVTLGPGVEAYHKLPEGLRLPGKASTSRSDPQLGRQIRGWPGAALTGPPNMIRGGAADQ